MALFNRDYDRNYGYRGTSPTGYGTDYRARGYDRDSGDRGEGTWESMKRNTREFFGLDNRYDRNYRYDRDLNTTYNRGNLTTPTGYGTHTRADHDRGFGAGSRSGFGSMSRYGRDYSGRGSATGYDRPYWGYDTWRYDAEYKSRQQTDTGDPFGDRESGTPIRVVDEPRDRGWFGRDRDYDRGYRYGTDHNARGYGRDYHATNPMGYDPYDTRGGGTHRLGRSRDTGYQNRNRGYDRGWF